METQSWSSFGGVEKGGVDSWLKRRHVEMNVQQCSSDFESDHNSSRQQASELFRFPN